MNINEHALRTIKLFFVAMLLIAAADSYAQEDEPTTVTVIEVTSSSIAPNVPAAGTVFSRNETLITAGMAGRLEWLAEPGDYIAAGAAVAIFDCEMLGLQRERQVAEAERASINHQRLIREVERLESVRGSNVIAEIQLDRTSADRDLAKSDLRIAEIAILETDSQLRRCSVRAPFSGIVTQRLRNAGEDVERSVSLAAMTDTENLEVRASVPIRHLPRMRSNVIAEVHMNDIRLEARIRKVVPAANSQSQTFEVRLELPENASHLVAAGQLVSVNLPLAPNVALTVPRDSVLLRENGTFVMRINADEKAELIAVEVSEAKGDHIAVSGELRSGDRVAVRGADGLDEGELVAVHSET